MPKYTAKKNIIAKINTGSVFESQWYLERKSKEEFSTRNELTGKDGESLKLVFDKTFNGHGSSNPTS